MTTLELTSEAVEVVRLFFVLNIYREERRVLEQIGTSASAAVPGSAPVLLQASAGDKKRVGVLMLCLRDLLMA